MKSTVVIVILAAVLCVAAGVAIAGLPNTPPGAEIVVLEVPVVETRPVPTLPAVTIEPLEQATTSSSSTSTSSTTTSSSTTTTTEVAATTTAPAETSAPAITQLDESTADALRERTELSVAAANATDLTGIAGTHADLLEVAGYLEVASVDSQVSPVSAVYYQPGFELEATRLATDLGWDPLSLAPMPEIPELATDSTFDLVALVGLDRT
jgi:hypothetical protein